LNFVKLRIVFENALMFFQQAEVLVHFWIGIQSFVKCLVITLSSSPELNHRNFRRIIFSNQASHRVGWLLIICLCCDCSFSFCCDFAVIAHPHLQPLQTFVELARCGMVMTSRTQFHFR